MIATCKLVAGLPTIPIPRQECRVAVSEAADDAVISKKNTKTVLTPIHDSFKHPKSPNDFVSFLLYSFQSLQYVTATEETASSRDILPRPAPYLMELDALIA